MRTAPLRSLYLVVTLTACATYTARPVETSGAAARFHARSLDAPAVLGALDSVGVHPDSTGWDDWELAEAAWILRPERERLAAEVRVAEAARITAGAHERPGLLSETEYSFSGTRGESRWGIALSAIFMVEFGGKRGARVGRANAGVLAAVARSDQQAWEVRWRVHDAATRQAIARRLLAGSIREAEFTDTVARLMHQRYDEGATSRTEVARADAERQTALAEIAARRHDTTTAGAELAAAVGVSAAALARITLAVPLPPGCALGIERDSLQVRALRLRPELRVVLAEYQVAEADVRLEVANSWPDLQLGPGLFFDHGVGKWTIGFGLPSLPLNRNRGPIAEAEARREVAAARIAEAQERVLEDVDQAAAGCASAAAEREALDLAGARERLALAEAAFDRGESGRLDVALARLELARAEGRTAGLEARLAQASLAMEHALGSWGPWAGTAGERKGR